MAAGSLQRSSGHLDSLRGRGGTEKGRKERGGRMKGKLGGKGMEWEREGKWELSKGKISGKGRPPTKFGNTSTQWLYYGCLEWFFCNLCIN